MTVHDIKLVSIEDGYEGLYVDGKLVYQNHYINVGEFVCFLQSRGLLSDIQFDDPFLTEESDAKVKDAGGFPEDFSDLNTS